MGTSFESYCGVYFIYFYLFRFQWAWLQELGQFNVALDYQGSEKYQN